MLTATSNFLLVLRLEVANQAVVLELFPNRPNEDGRHATSRRLGRQPDSNATAHGQRDSAARLILTLLRRCFAAVLTV